MIAFIKKIFKKYREQIAYLFFGGLTTLVSWGVSSALYYFVFGEGHSVISNVISEAVAITFAYVTNKLFVFNSVTPDFGSFIKEVAKFYAFRIASTLFNVGAMYLLVDLWNCEFWVCKIAVNVVVILLNYLFSKLFVFKSGNRSDGDAEGVARKEELTEEFVKSERDTEEKKSEGNRNE